MNVLALLNYLGLPGDGCAEITTNKGRGYFTQPDQIAHAASVERGAILNVHPFEKDCATEETGPHIQLVQPEMFGALVARFWHPPDDEARVDTSTVAKWLVENTSAAVWFAYNSSEDRVYGYLVAAVEPFKIQDDLEPAKQEWIKQLSAKISHQFDDVQLTLMTAGVPIDGGHLAAEVERKPSVKLRNMLYRPMPERVMNRMNRGAGQNQYAKLFRSRLSSLGTDDKGNEIERTEENFDRAFVYALACAKENFTHDEIVNALWNRPNCVVKAEGLPAVETFVSQIAEAAIKKRDSRSKAPDRAKPQVQPDQSLRELLHEHYYQVSESTGGYVPRHDVEISYKARIVIEYLLAKGAEFYYFKGSNETVFVVDGQQVPVDETNSTYQRWFIRHVEYFSPEETPGKALTLALRVNIQDHPNTHKPPNSLWGRYDKKTETLYYCFDPEHMQMIKVEPTYEGPCRISVIQNGAEGVTLRGMQMRIRPLEYDKGATEHHGAESTAWDLFVDDLHNGQALPTGDKTLPNYRLISTVYNLCTLIPGHRQRPIKFHTGAEGSGKTTAATDLGYILYGITPGADYSELIILAKDISQGGPYIVQDNAENKDRRKFGQLYLVATTGNPIKTRKLFKTAEDVVFEPNGSLVLTAIEGFHRPEEIRRTFSFEFDAKWWSTHRDDIGTRMERIENNGDRILSAILQMFSRYLLPGLQNKFADAKDWLQKTENNKLLGNKKPYLGWIAYMLVMTRSLGPVITRDPEFNADYEFRRWLQTTYYEDSHARIAADPSMDLLEALRNESALAMDRENVNRLNLNEFGHIDVEQRDGVMTFGPATTGALFRAFGALSRRCGIPLEHKNSVALGKRLQSLSNQPMFALAGWTREEATKDRTGSRRYVYTWSAGDTSAAKDHDLAPTQTDSVVDSVLD